MRTISFATFGAVVGTLAGCPAPPNSLARAQQAAQEFNLDSRLGHGELSLERVAPEAREQYTNQHRAWGTNVRVVDVELVGMKAQGERDVTAFVRVAWYRPEDEELRSTTVEQCWTDKPAGWQLVREHRVEGEAGLLGEQVFYQGPEAPRPRQFPTVRLSGSVEPESE
jgi:hypothetical protein